VKSPRRVGYISKDADRANSFLLRIFLRSPNHLRNPTLLCSADDSLQSPIFHSCTSYFARAPCRFIDSLLPISPVTRDHDGLFELPAVQGGA
jgi:hypothetical protein